MLLYQSEVGLAPINLETSLNRLSMPPCNRRRKLGPGCAAWGAAAPWLARLATAFARWAGGWAQAPPTPVFCPGKLCRWASLCISFAHFFITLSALRIFALRFLNCAFCLVFHLYSNICPTKHDSSNTSGTMSIVKAYVLKFCLFLLFWIVIGGQIWSLRTANKSPKLNLCSSRAYS